MDVSQTPSRRLFESIVISLLTAFFAFVMYASLHYPGGTWPNPWPLWLRCTIAAWFLANAFLAYWLRERLLRSESQMERELRARSTSWHIAIGFGVCWLIIVTYLGAAGVRGVLPLGRTIGPACFLLIFSWVFSWSLYLAERGKQ